MKSATHMHTAKNARTQLGHKKKKVTLYVSGQGMLICSAKDWYCPVGRMVIGARNTVPRVKRQNPDLPFEAVQKCWSNFKVLWHFPSFLSFPLSTPKHGTAQNFWTCKTFGGMIDSRFYELSGASQPSDNPRITWTAAFLAISWLCCSQFAWNQLMH